MGAFINSAFICFCVSDPDMHGSGRIRMHGSGYACMDPDTHAWIRIHFASWSRIRNTEEEKKVDVQNVFSSVLQ